MRTLVAHQAQYAPYPGVLHKLFTADVFVFQDDVQFVKQEFQNRNRIRTPDGWKWLTIPVKYKSTHRIMDVLPADGAWKEKHRRMIHMYYAKSPHLQRLDEFWQRAELYKEAPLSELAYHTTLALAELIDSGALAGKQIVIESELGLTAEETSTPTKRLIALCKKLGCDRYLSGAGGQAYLEVDAWKKEGIELEWQHFTLPKYGQMYPGWEPNLSTIDLVLSVDQPIEYMKV